MGIEIERLSRLDDHTLEVILGVSIVRAVKENFDTNVRSILAELVLLKYGKSLLDNQLIRSAIIDTLSTDEFEPLKNAIQATNANNVDPYQYFSNGYSELKSKQLVDSLGFSPDCHKQVIVETRKEIEHVSPKFGETAKLKGYLHPYQKNIKDQILFSLKNPGTRLMVQMPTGSGKTFTALETAVDILRRPFQQKFVVWIVNKNELAEQALSSFSELWKTKGDRPLTLFRWFSSFTPDFREHPEGGVVFATYDLFSSVLNRINDKRRPGLLHLINNTEYLIVDEAHSSIADTYEQCVTAFVNTDTTQIVGLTATPFRNEPEDGESLMRLYSGNLIEMQDPEGNIISDPIRYLQDLGALSRVEVTKLETGVSLEGSDENAILKQLAENGQRNSEILKQIEYANSLGEKTLVFACTKDHVLALFILCKSKEVSAGFITGDVPQNERLDLLKKFNDEDLNVLINLDILSTGIDLPNVNRLILTRPVRSSIEYSQIVGRVLRGPINGGNKVNSIVNIADNIDYFSDISLLYDGFKNAWGDQ